MNAGTPSTGTSPEVVPVAIYTRVSTDNQVGGRFDSCESQLAICRDHIRKNAAAGWTEVAHYTDPAFSGSTMNRPGLRNLMDHIRRGEVRVVLIFKLERMSRNIDEWGPFRNFLKQHGCRLESATEDISESTPSGRLKNNLMLSFSQYERENTAEKTLTKMHQQARRGYWNGGAVPYGYAYDKNTQSLKPDPVEAPIVRRIYDEAARSRTPEQIADGLNSEGLRTRLRLFRRTDGTERSVGEKRFRSENLRGLIMNPVYRGVIRYAGAEYPGKHQAIVPSELWERASAAVANYVRPPDIVQTERDKHSHLLKGLLVCGSCQRAMIPHPTGHKDKSGKPYRYYACNQLIKERGDVPCDVRHVAAGAIESAAMRYLSEIGKHPDIVEAAVFASRKNRQSRRAELKAEIAGIDRDLTEARKSIHNCVKAISAGGAQIAEELSAEVKRSKDREQELAVIRAKRSQELAGYEAEFLTHRQVLQSLEQFGRILNGLSPEDRKALVRLFVERIEVRPTSGASIRSSRRSTRHLELRFRMTIPRLVEGKSDRLIVESSATQPLMRGVSLSATVTVGQQGRYEQAAVVAPFRSGEGTEDTSPPIAQSARAHPIRRALAWKRKLDENRGLGLRGLARKEGVFAPTVVQHLKLLNLAPEIQQYLAKVHDPAGIRFFSVRRLGVLAKLPWAAQKRTFDGWRKAVEAERAAHQQARPHLSMKATFPMTQTRASFRP